VQATTTRPKITVSADGQGVVSHAGSRLLADVADRTTSTAELAEALAELRRPRARHDPGWVLVDMAVAVADGATTISEVAVLADQVDLFGSVASDSTCWRLLDGPGTAQLGRIARARAAAREVVWAQRAELCGRPFPPGRTAGRELPGLVIDLDASIVVCHSEKELAAPTVKRTFGYHPMLAFSRQHRRVPRCAAAPRERGQQHRRRPHHRPGRRAGPAPRRAPARRPDPGSRRHRRVHAGVPRPRPRPGRGCGELRILGRLGDHGQGTCRNHRDSCPGLGGRDRRRRRTPRRRRARRDHRCPADPILGRLPVGTRVIVRRERPHPGAQLDAFEERDGWRYTAFATDTRAGQLAALDARHRTRPGRGPDPLREGHRPGPVPVAVVRDQRRVAGRGHACGRPDRLDPAPAPAR